MPSDWMKCLDGFDDEYTGTFSREKLKRWESFVNRDESWCELEEDRKFEVPKKTSHVLELTEEEGRARLQPLRWARTIHLEMFSMHVKQEHGCNQFQGTKQFNLSEHEDTSPSSKVSKRMSRTKPKVEAELAPRVSLVCSILIFLLKSDNP